MWYCHIFNPILLLYMCGASILPTLRDIYVNPMLSVPVYNRIEIPDGRMVRVGVSVHEMYCHDLEVMSLNPGQVKVGVCGIFVVL